jgi:pyrimidine deaminase RibD-like protein
MQVIGEVADTTKHQSDVGPPYEAGTLYELQSCPECGKTVLVSGPWHDQMEDPEEWKPSVVLPETRDRVARELLASHGLDIQCMLAAVAEARKCTSEGNAVKPKVGAAVSRENVLVASAHRGELEAGQHAEYTLLEGKCTSEILAGATVYTTLEPCTSRNPPKVACVDRLIARKVSRVVIGMLDPDERIRGRGILALRKANIRVDLFPPDLMTELEELNRDFISDKERGENRRLRDIATAVVARSDHAPDSTAEAKREVVLLAKYMLAAIIKLPNGGPEGIQRADRLFREALLPSDEELSQLRQSASRVGSSAGELALAATENVGWMLRVVREVQSTSREMGFDYRHINWKEWTFHWIEAEQRLKALLTV